MVTTIVSGEVVERRKSWHRSAPQSRGKRKKGNSSEKKIVGNREYAKLECARMLNCNFTAGDLWITLKYDNEHLVEDRKGAKRCAENFVRRLCRRLEKLGAEVRWAYNTSNVDGDTGEAVRWHHHLVITGAPFVIRDRKLWLGDELLCEIWGNGGIDYQLLRRQKDYKPLANYIVNQGGFEPNEKKWTCSRNMKKPKITRKIVASGGQLRIPAGATELPGCRYDPERGQNYVRYIRQDAGKKVGGHKEIASMLASEAAEELDSGGL